jgi:hypothetical protein
MEHKADTITIAIATIKTTITTVCTTPATVRTAQYPRFMSSSRSKP